MAAVNKVILVGNVGRDPEIKAVGDDLRVAELSLGVTMRRGQSEETEWFRVKCWRKLADVCEKYVRKGQQLYVEGQIHTRSYEKNGETRYVTVINTDVIQMLGGRPQQQEQGEEYQSRYDAIAQPQPQPRQEELRSPDEGGVNDLPF